MKVLGIIAEYNPFHNGHLYHLKRSMEITGSKYCVVVMSGNFVQRGEPALMNKWARAKTALEGGSDLVIELPVVFSLSSAEMFATGAVKLMDAMGIINCMAFGSETGEIGPLYRIGAILANETQEFKHLLRKKLSAGYSFPEARQLALEELVPHTDASLLTSSNNILAVEYIKALLRINSTIEPFTLKRIGNEYLDTKLKGAYPSATSIRNALSGGSLEGIKGCVPEFSHAIITDETTAGRCPVTMDFFEDILLSKLRKMSPGDILAYPYVGEGLENRIYRGIGAAGSLNELVEFILTRRYPETRIKRILAHILLDITHGPLPAKGPLYARVLGFNDRGRELLRMMKGTSLIPVITKPAHIHRFEDPSIKRMFEIESAATDIYTLAHKNPLDRIKSQDYTTDPVQK